MRAARLERYGGKEAVRYTTDARQPSAGPGQVLVEVYAASVNPFDWKVREGMVQQMAPLTFPATLGGDVAGIVAEIGEGVNSFDVGQEVYGQANALSGTGSFAEFTPVKAASLAPKPQSVNFMQAAALPLAACSAYQALVDTIHLSKGQHILIHGGAGGIGGFAIQLAKHLGAQIATTVRAEDADYVRGLGADEVIDYASDTFEERLQRLDAVFDLVGGEVYSRSFNVLRPGGQIVSMLEEPNEELMRQHEVTAFHQSTHVTAERLGHIAQLVDHGALTVTLDKTFRLEEAAEAIEYIHTIHHRGKIVLGIK